ncbi:MAG: DUF6777 domain-containing protein [Actinomycetota bacterium]|nr:DUF6777 domain-containing protein [Actinomycetota bacterium]
MPGVVESITRSRMRAVGAGIVLGLVLLAVALPLTAAAFGGGSSGGEVFLEPADSIGADPFTDALFTTPTSIAAVLPAGTDAGSGDIEAVSGDAAGLYGGTTDNASCDAELLTAFLTDPANAAKAAAWAGVHGIDVDDIADYIDDLTPMVLRQDTRVTNHGFRDGAARPLQSVLQAGTAVLVDDRGVPRVRCACGNPLLEPEPVSGSVDYQGDGWPDFSADAVFRITSGETVERFILVDLETGELFERPVGGDGTTDRVLGEELDEESSALVDLGDVPVPLVIGIDVAEAIDLLEAESFEVTVVERPDDEIPEGVVILSDPRAGSTLAPGAEVLLLVSSGPDEGPNPAQTTTSTTTDGPGGTTSTTERRGTSSTTDRPGTTSTTTRPGTSSTTTSSTTSSTTTTSTTEPEQTLADFTGTDANAAEGQLKQLGIRTTRRGVVDKASLWTVVGQDPPAGTPLSQVRSVTLGVSGYQLPHYGALERRVREVRADLVDHGLTPVFVNANGGQIAEPCLASYVSTQNQVPQQGTVVARAGTSVQVEVLDDGACNETPVRTIPTVITIPDTIVTIPRERLPIDVRPSGDTDDVLR